MLSKITKAYVTMFDKKMLNGESLLELVFIKLWSIGFVTQFYKESFMLFRIETS